MAASPGAVTGELVQSVNPATLEPVGCVPAAAPGEVQEAVAEARLAQERWARRPLRERRQLLLRVAAAALTAMDEIAATVTAETGKPLVESYTMDLFPAVENARWIAASLERTLATERLHTPQLFLKHKRGSIRHEPLGAVAIVSPWNFPFGIPLSQAAAAVAAGNSVLLKPAEETPLSGEWVARVFADAGAPDGLVRVLQGRGETVGDALVRVRGVAKVFFTGSSETGRAVATAAAERLCPVNLELGGRDPMLVFADADVERAVQGALWGGFANCGQVCSGVERIYVQRTLHDSFVARLVAAAGGLRVGRGDDLATELGPMISEAQRGRVEAAVTGARAAGAAIACGGRRPDLGLPGWFYEPTVLLGGAPDDEIFGPVVTVEPFDGEREAVALANASRYGLGASVWTADRGLAARVGAALEAGSVWTNDVAYSYFAGQAPWGGRKQSGYGRTHSRHGLYECSQAKFTDADSGRLRVPWWYPYDARAPDAFRAALAVLYGRGASTRAHAVWQHRRGLATLARRYGSR